MSISQTLQDAITWLAYLGSGLGVLTIIFFIFNWGGKFRLVGATIFTLLLSASCWAFNESYHPPVTVEGAIYAPVVYDNGLDLVVAQAQKGFPNEAIQPTLEQIAGNLKGVGRNRKLVHVRIRKLESAGKGISKPIIMGEVIRDVVENTTLPLPNPTQLEETQLIEKEENQSRENEESPENEDFAKNEL